MENRQVGYLILGISAVIVFIIFIYNNAINKIVDTCPIVQAGYICPAHGAVTQQMYLSLAIVGVLIVIALVLIVSKQTEKIIVKKDIEKKQKKNMDMKDLRNEERQILGFIQKEGAIFQATLIEKTGIGKAKMTRILDRLEGKGFIERKRRGMMNVVVLKQQS